MKVTYISIWDGDRIETYCDYDPTTGEVSNIDQVDIGNDYNVCEREFIELPDGTEIEIKHEDE